MPPGSLPVDAARRTRARRMAAPVFAGIRSETGPDGIPSVPEPMPEELRTTLIEAYWRGLSWRELATMSLGAGLLTLTARCEEC